MDARTSTTSEASRTRLLLVDTDNLFLDSVATTLQTNEDVDVVASVRSIEDAYECAAKHVPDVIVISWSKASRAFVHAVVETLFSPLANPLIVIVLPGDVTSLPGLSTISLMPNVALVVHTHLEKLLRRHTLQASSVQMH